MKQRKKNNFFTFIFAFLPGAAEMYMGFMKNGLSILALFIAPIICTGILHGADYIAILSGIIYIAAFFHAINIGFAPDEEFNSLKDMYVWEEFSDANLPGISKKTSKKWIAIALIIVGAGEAWNVITNILLKTLINVPEQYRDMIKGIMTSVPRLAVAVLVIVFGTLLIRGKKKELIEDEKNE